jgi:hypothetical protein
MPARTGTWYKIAVRVIGIAYIESTHLTPDTLASIKSGVYNGSVILVAQPDAIRHVDL